MDVLEGVIHDDHDGGADMRIISGILIGAVMTTSASAEPLAIQDSFSRTEGVVGLGLTIPIGGGRDKAPPRVELRLTRDVVNFDGTRQSAALQYQMGTRIGFSLAPGHRLLLNGEPVEDLRKNGMSTLGWVAVGVGATLIIGGVLVADAARDASE